ncbi:hypothetical protein C7U92_28675 [Bradyrhizobium sp. WBOS7]|nr:hypothetical protein [Bradyrhizobium sp. WBOS2]MDD1580665.1 hypothetical protein [Bradyrhizobium sp. WBOS7]
MRGARLPSLSPVLEVGALCSRHRLVSQVQRHCHSGARSEPGISRYSGAQLRTVVRLFEPPRNDGFAVTSSPSAAPRSGPSDRPRY